MEKDHRKNIPEGEFIGGTFDAMKERKMLMNETTVQVRRIPKWVYDAEYATQNMDEVAYLEAHGFKPAFIRENAQYGVKTWKYTKTGELFHAVADFYDQKRYKEEMETLNKAMDILAKKGNAEEAKHIFGILNSGRCSIGCDTDGDH